ncbi:MAG: GH116 family glycosyl-hydrolase [Candidatus Caldarchaeum sp.]
MPLGGIGTGHFCLCADGSLRQWQIYNVVNHLAFLPGTFFALCLKKPQEKPKASLLLSRRFLSQPPEVTAPSVSDHYVPDELKKLAPYALVPPREEGFAVPHEDTGLRGEAIMTASYPIAWLDFLLPDEKIRCALTAWTPFLIFDPDLSGMPLAVFDFEFYNFSESPVEVTFLASWQNSIGWDGISAIRDTLNLNYGGNVNQFLRLMGRAEVRMRNVRLPRNHPAWGNTTLALFGEHSFGFSWRDFSQLWQGLLDFSFEGFASTTPPSRPGKTYNSSLGCKFTMLPREEKKTTVMFAWFFPNRYVNFEQHPTARTIESPAYLGNYYTRVFESSWHVVEIAKNKLAFLREETMKLAEALNSSACPEVASAVSSNLATLRTAVCFRTEDGHFFAFEGGCGASTGKMEAVGGCCPLNCTHVWNYDQTLLSFFPELHRDMRDIDWFHNQHPSGYLPHRTILPLSLPPLWDVEIGGPSNPAVDGLLAAILKTYQYWQTFESDEWFKSVLHPLTRAFDYLWEKLDTSGEGVLSGEQPCTYDISLYGPNTFIGSQYLAALRAGERIFKRIDPKRAQECQRRFASGFHLYDSLCFNGEYYHQHVNRDEYEYQYEMGCFADQLLGQWWAHILRLGYVLPPAHVRQTLRTVFKRNFYPEMGIVTQSPRVFVMPHESGMLNVFYAEGTRPKVPLLYSDEVWSGVEYAVSALMIFERMLEEGLILVGAVQERYSGKYRNPFNEVECGDHYIRSLSAFSLLLALSGAHYERFQGGTLFFHPKIILRDKETRYFFSAGRSYGDLFIELIHKGLIGRIRVRSGSCAFRKFEIKFPPWVQRLLGRGTMTIENASMNTFGRKTARGNWIAQGDFFVSTEEGLLFEIRM